MCAAGRETRRAASVNHPRWLRRSADSRRLTRKVAGEICRFPWRHDHTNDARKRGPDRPAAPSDAVRLGGPAPRTGQNLHLRPARGPAGQGLDGAACPGALRPGQPNGRRMGRRRLRGDRPRPRQHQARHGDRGRDTAADRRPRGPRLLDEPVLRLPPGPGARCHPAHGRQEAGRLQDGSLRRADRQARIGGRAHPVEAAAGPGPPRRRRRDTPDAPRTGSPGRVHHRRHQNA